MCLITRFPRIKTKKDIEVYKVLRNDLVSPYQHYKYLLNALVISDFKARCVRLINGTIPTDYAEDILPDKIIESRTRNASIYYKFTDIQNINLDIQYIENGLHSYRDISKALFSVSDWNEEYRVYKAIIPAGSYIYINYNEIVSDKLIIKEQIP